MKRVAIPMEELVPILQLQMEASGSANLTVTGWSMLPMLHNRLDTVTIAPVEGPGRKGDVVLYRRENGQYVLHRILRKRKHDYVFCGDNQFFTEKVKQEQFLALVTGFTRKGKCYSTENNRYRRYVWWWVNFHPVRWLYLVPRRFCGWVKTKLKKKRRAWADSHRDLHGFE